MNDDFFDQTDWKDMERGNFNTQFKPTLLNKWDTCIFPTSYTTADPKEILNVKNYANFDLNLNLEG